MKYNKRLVFGVGVNDSPSESCEKTVDGIKKTSFYTAWTNMLRRCYSDTFQDIQKSYVGCTVCEEWLTFSNFKAWMEKQDWKGNQLDKDIIFSGNKKYSPDACAFVSKKTNTFANEQCARRGGSMLGVSWNKDRSKFESHCRNPFTNKNEFLGRHESAAQAHEAWRIRKHDLACQLAKHQTDSRVSKALVVRYI